MTSNQVIAAAAVAQLVVVVLALFVAWRQVLEARRLRLAQHRPYVIVDFEAQRSELLELVVRNVGDLPAFDVQLQFEPPLTTPPSGSGGADLPSLPMFLSGVAMMAPGRAYRYSYGTAHTMLVADREMAHDVRISYSARLAGYPPRYDEQHKLDLAPVRNSLIPKPGER